MVPFSFHLIPLKGRLIAVKSGLFHTVVSVVVENMMGCFFFINLHQAVRLVVVAGFLKAAGMSV